MLRRSFGFFQILLLTAFAITLSGADYLGQKRLERSRNIAETFFEITVFDSDLDPEDLSSTVDQAFGIIETVQNKMSATKTDSVVSRINQAKEGEVFQLDDDTFLILKDALRVSELAEGGFDITDEPIRRLWREAKEKSAPAAQEAIERVLPSVGYKALSLDLTSKKLIIQKQGVEINLEDIASGFAADKAALYLKIHGVKSAIVKAGEGLRIIGLCQESRYWRVGIEHPRKIDDYAAVLELDTEHSVATTGDYENFFIFKDKRYPLVFDPKTGHPPDNHVVSVTVIAENIAFANILSKMFFILGPEKSFQFADRLKEEGIQIVFIEEPTKDRLILSSSEGIHGNLKDIAL